MNKDTGRFFGALLRFRLNGPRLKSIATCFFVFPEEVSHVGNQVVNQKALKDAPREFSVGPRRRGRLRGLGRAPSTRRAAGATAAEGSVERRARSTGRRSDGPPPGRAVGARVDGGLEGAVGWAVLAAGWTALRVDGPRRPLARVRSRRRPRRRGLARGRSRGRRSARRPSGTVRDGAVDDRRTGVECSSAARGMFRICLLPNEALAQWSARRTWERAARRFDSEPGPFCPPAVSPRREVRTTLERRPAGHRPRRRRPRAQSAGAPSRRRGLGGPLGRSALRQRAVGGRLRSAGPSTVFGPTTLDWPRGADSADRPREPSARRPSRGRPTGPPSTTLGPATLEGLTHGTALRPTTLEGLPQRTALDDPPAGDPRGGPPPDHPRGCPGPTTLGRAPWWTALDDPPAGDPRGCPPPDGPRGCAGPTALGAALRPTALEGAPGRRPSRLPSIRRPSRVPQPAALDSPRRPSCQGSTRPVRRGPRGCLGSRPSSAPSSRRLSKGGRPGGPWRPSAALGCAHSPASLGSPSSDRSQSHFPPEDHPVDHHRPGIPLTTIGEPAPRASPRLLFPQPCNRTERHEHPCRH